MNNSDKIRVVFLRDWHEYALFNIDDIDDGAVIAQGQMSSRYYIVVLDNTMRAVSAELQ